MNLELILDRVESARHHHTHTEHRQLYQLLLTDRLMAEHPRTQKQIADELGISKSNVSPYETYLTRFLRQYGGNLGITDDGSRLAQVLFHDVPVRGRPTSP